MEAFTREWRRRTYLHYMKSVGGHVLDIATRPFPATAMPSAKLKTSRLRRAIYLGSEYPPTYLERITAQQNPKFAEYLSTRSGRSLSLIEPDDSTAEYAKMLASKTVHEGNDTTSLVAIIKRQEGQDEQQQEQISDTFVGYGLGAAAYSKFGIMYDSWRAVHELFSDTSLDMMEKYIRNSDATGLMVATALDEGNNRLVVARLV